MVYVMFFCAQFNAPLRAEYWIRDEMILKKHLASRMPSPKIVIVSGSNGLFGLNSKMLSDYSGMPVVNATLHAGLPLDWLLHYANDIAKKGDIVILPLEATYYYLDFSHPSLWMMKQVTTWNKEYFYSLSLIRKVQFITSEPIMMLIDRCKQKMHKKKIFKKYPDRKARSPEILIKNYETYPKFKAFNYHYLNTNAQGDLMNTCSLGSHPPALEKVNYFSTAKFNWRALALLQSTIKKMEKRGVQVWISFPPMVKNERTQSEGTKENMKSLLSILADLKISVLGSPIDFTVFDKTDYIDTEYHLTCTARDKRSKILGEQIRSLLMAHDLTL